MGDDELVVLKRFDNGIEAEFFRSYLESNDIEASVTNANQPINITVSGFSVTGNAGILVRQRDLEKARELIQEYQEVEQDDLEDDTTEDGDRYYGVKGWLAFFCFSLIVISPFYNLMIAIGTWSEVKPLFAYVPHLRFVAIVEMILRAFFIGFSTTAGVMLWRKMPRAVKTAKIFMISFLLFIFYLILSPYFITRDWELVADFFDEATFFSVIQAAVYFIIWFTYLSKSRRVAATYGSR